MVDRAATSANELHARNVSVGRWLKLLQ